MTLSLSWLRAGKPLPSAHALGLPVIPHQGDGRGVHSVFPIGHQLHQLCLDGDLPGVHLCQQVGMPGSLGRRRWLWERRIVSHPGEWRLPVGLGQAAEHRLGLSGARNTNRITCPGRGLGA